MAALPGWTRLGGRAERYRNPQGEEVSRRQYENARARAAGWANWSEYQRTRKSDDYNRWLNKAIDEQGLTRRDIGVSSDFSRHYLDVKSARAYARDTGDESDLRDPNGTLADFLVYIGARDAEDWWDVGDTPGETGK